MLILQIFLVLRFLVKGIYTLSQLPNIFKYFQIFVVFRFFRELTLCRNSAATLSRHSFHLEMAEILSPNTPPGAKLGLCRSTIYSKFFIVGVLNASPRQIFNFFPNYPPPDHNLGQILNSDLASSYFPLKVFLEQCEVGW